MDVGVSLFFQNFDDFERCVARDFTRQSAVSDSDVYRDTLALGDLVEPLGFDSLWTVEHHFSPYAMTDDPLQLLAYFAGRTERIALGTMVLVAPWHDPIRLAEGICVLDHLSDGRRLYLGFGRGSAPRELDGMRVNRDDSRGRWEEALDVVRLALTRESFSYEGRYHRIPEVNVRPRPRSSDLTERMFCAWSSDESLQFAADAGFAQLFISLQSWEHAASSTASFNAIRAGHGWDPVDPIAVVFVYCRESETEAAAGEVFLRNMMDASIQHYDLLSGIREHAGGDLSDDELIEMLRSSFVELNVWGTPDQCLEQLRSISQTVNCAAFIGVFYYGGMAVDDAEASMRLFARDVLPTVHTWRGSEPRSIASDRVAAQRGRGRASVAGHN
jgi:alkanesulfonate monooxygenase SsuD/methylene tetrahydromethanopterin reductase-like flavin-dependent oxidoreductase (luciferase family)